MRVELNTSIAVRIITALLLKFIGEFRMDVENGLVTFGMIIGLRVGYNKCYKSHRDITDQLLPC